MKIIYWGAVVSFSLMLLNVLLLMSAKAVHREPLVPEDAILIAAGLFGVVMATVTYRQWIRKGKSKGSRR